MDKNCCILQNLKKCRMEKGRCTHKYLTVKKYPRTFIVERRLSFFLFFLFFLLSFLFCLSFRPCLKTCKRNLHLFFLASGSGYPGTGSLVRDTSSASLSLILCFASLSFFFCLGTAQKYKRFTYYL